MKRFLFVLLSILIFSCSLHKKEYVLTYTGLPYQDSTLNIPKHILPGIIQCEYYDFGGEGVAYHDSDNKNSGSGELNKGISYLDQFRVSEAVDISYTKFHDDIDNSPYSIVKPKKDQLYIGWTEPGEWIRYTVNVQESGMYQVGAMYTSNRGGSIRLFIDDTDSTNQINIPTTYDSMIH
ncbi:MAG: carbohydrate-binding protein [Bacteroidales bacterium]|nr:carbohydrate-binding protein [Bacteroidales bacterium]